ncbi:MAG: FecR domain-containing protein [Bacteroidia bacterium]|nr:FecR domain-containing protein [Bacteroidia bacterium]
MQENYLAKWLTNELSPEELEAFKASPEYSSYRKLADISSQLEAPAFDAEEAFLDNVKRRAAQEPKVVRLNTKRTLWRVAAAIAVIFALSLGYVSTLTERINTQYAERSEVQLPDNSEVILNAGSKLTYHKKKWASDRRVTLKGEAFFKVAKGATFSVETESGIVQVLGTQFNVEQRPNFFEVSCYEGLVSVVYQDQEYKLPAGSSFIVMDGSQITDTVPVNAQPSWVLNESSFKSIPLAFVLDELKRQYDIRVETENIDLSQKFTGTFSNTNLDLALQSISTPAQISYTLEGNKVLFYAKEIP